MSNRNLYAALKKISSWSVDDVQTVLQQNGLESTCHAFRKREIDGENLLNLTEGKLALWKRDLTLVEIRKLANFVRDLGTSPEQFLPIQNEKQNGSAKPHEEAPSLPPLPPFPPRPRSPGSDTGSWGTDFEDEPDAEDIYSEPSEDNHPQLPAKPSGGYLHSKSSPSSDRHMVKTNSSLNRPTANGGFLHQYKSSNVSDHRVDSTNSSINTSNGGFLSSKKSPTSSDRHVATTNPSLNTGNGGFLYSNKSSTSPDRHVATTNPSVNTANGGSLYPRSPSHSAPQNPNENSDSIKPPIPNRPAGMALRNGGYPSANASALFGLPKPPTPPTLERLISTLNISETTRHEDEYFEEDEYTSIDEGTGSNPQSLGFPPSKEVPAQPPRIDLPPRKVVPAQQLPMELPPRNTTPVNQPPLDLPPRKLSPTQQPTLEQIRGANRTHYPKMSFDASRSRPPTVSPVNQPKPILSLEGETHFNNIPAGIPNQISALANNRKIAQGLKPAMALPGNNNGSTLSLDKMANISSSNENLNSEIPAKQLPLELPPRNIIPAKQPVELPTRKLTPTQQPTLEQIRGASPTPYPKFSFGTSRSRPPPVPDFPLQDETHFNNIPAGIPNQMSALSNSNKSGHGLKPAMPLPGSNHGSTHSLDKIGSTLTSSDWSSNEYELNLEEEYEIIMEKPQTDYYLKPLVAPTPVLPVPKPFRAAPVAPEIVTPSTRPPSPPRKKSFPEDVTQDLADKLRAELMKKQQASNTSKNEAEQEKSPMPELQKTPPVGLGPRPLPPTPDAARKPGTDKMNPHRNSRVLTHMPWYHNVDRKRAEEMLTNGEDGKFILRPSTQTQNPLTLTLWYSKRLYNISVRQRTDQRYALGTEKPKEQSFSTVEELVKHYQGEELVLHSKGERTGKTLLTSSPPRQSS